MTRSKLRKIRSGLLVYMAAVSLPWIILRIPGKLFAAASLLPFPILLILLALYPEDTTLSEDPKVIGTRAELLTPMLFAAVLPVFRMWDYSFLSNKMLFLWTFGLSAAVIGIFTVYYEEMRRKISIFFTAALLCFFFCFSATAHLNYILDFSRPREQTAAITDMYINTSSKGRDSYILTVSTQGWSDANLNVSRERYEATRIGDQVTIFISGGGLGIPYAEVE